MGDEIRSNWESLRGEMYREWSGLAVIELWLVCTIAGLVAGLLVAARNGWIGS
jgi:hypothetical protein